MPLANTLAPSAPLDNAPRTTNSADENSTAPPLHNNYMVLHGDRDSPQFVHPGIDGDDPHDGIMIPRMLPQVPNAGRTESRAPLDIVTTDILASAAAACYGIGILFRSIEQEL